MKRKIGLIITSVVASVFLLSATASAWGGSSGDVDVDIELAHRSSGWSPILRETLRVIAHIDQVCGLERARRLINGHALLEMGMQPGPELGKILEIIHDRILAGEITTQEEALVEARALLPHPDQEGN